MAIHVLENKKILVLKSRRGEDDLLEYLRNSRAILTYFPVVETEPNFSSKTVTSAFNNLKKYKLAIFVSPNAVKFAFEYLDNMKFTLPTEISYFAVGKVSAKLLCERVGNVIYPKANFSSEGLLELPQLKQVSGERILIFRGGQGSEILRDSLLLKAESVDYCDIYKRKINKNYLAQARKKMKDIDCLVVFSAQVLSSLGNLNAICGNHDWRQLTLLVASRRLAKIGEELGYKSIKVANTSSVDGMELAFSEIFR